MESDQLIVFSDDWGRHPSSCQHLVRAMLPDFHVTWVNTIGMRPPRLDWLTVKRGAEKLASWTRFSGRSRPVSSADAVPEGLTVIDARMWPWMSHRWDRWLNGRLLLRQLTPFTQGGVAITTIPIVADLVGKLSARRWVYYCVDDFALWPGLDGKSLGEMENELLPKVDRIIAASDSLAEGVRRRGFQASVLTHGVDLDFWQSAAGSGASQSQEGGASPLVLFWGVVDRRMNADWLVALADRMQSGRIVLLGPQQDPDPRLRHHTKIQMPGPVAFDDLPGWASRASVLIMPYADQPVTRAMQPLKLKEYLATGRPVVVSRLPAVQSWEPHLYVAESIDEFVDQVHHAISAHRDHDCEANLHRRLLEESWLTKSHDFIERAITE